MVIVPNHHDDHDNNNDDNGDNREGEIEIAAQKNKITVVSADLPLVVMDGFVPDDMCQQIIDIARR